MADEWLNWLKIGVAVGTVLTAVICGTIVIRKNPKYWLNRLFTGFILGSALYFITFTKKYYIFLILILVFYFIIFFLLIYFGQKKARKIGSEES